MRKKINLIIVSLIVFVMLVSFFPVGLVKVNARETLSFEKYSRDVAGYTDVDGTTKAVNVTVLTASTTSLTGEDTWYYIDKDLVFSSRLEVSGKVNLIIGCGTNSIIKGGIHLPKGSSLTIYAGNDIKKVGEGRLAMDDTFSDINSAGIGGNENEEIGELTINGGLVIARAINGAAIGSGASNADNNLPSSAYTGKITINGGTVTGLSTSRGAAIGSGEYGYSVDATINGGYVSALAVRDTGNADGPGFGGQKLQGNLTINDGIVYIRSNKDAIRTKKVTLAGGRLFSNSELEFIRYGTELDIKYNTKISLGSSLDKLALVTKGNVDFNDIINSCVVLIEPAFDQYFVTEVKLIGKSSNSNEANLDEKAIILLEQEGYICVATDLNSSAGGDYIYLGYKMGNNYSKAIKEFYIKNGEVDNDFLLSSYNRMYYPVPLMGDESFIASYGDLNNNANGDSLHLYYTRYEINDKGDAVGGIYFDSDINNSVYNTNLNQGATGDKVYMHAINQTKYYISDIMVYGSRGGDSQAKSYLNKEGYFMVEVDTNRGNTSLFNIFLGYKTTESFDEAIKDVIILEGEDFKDKDIVYYNGLKYTKAAIGGGFNFTSGDLNRGSKGPYLFVYFTKEYIGEEKYAVNGLSLDARKNYGVSDATSVNKGTEGFDIYITLAKTSAKEDVASGKMVDFSEGVDVTDWFKEAQENNETLEIIIGNSIITFDKEAVKKVNDSGETVKLKYSESDDVRGIKVENAVKVVNIEFTNNSLKDVNARVAYKLDDELKSSEKVNVYYLDSEKGTLATSIVKDDRLVFNTNGNKQNVISTVKGDVDPDAKVLSVTKVALAWGVVVIFGLLVSLVIISNKKKKTK